jgi:TRAP-type mannitol/chloroaromatic compound transport system permease small subunit
LSPASQRIVDAIETFIDRTGRLASWLILGVVATLFLQIPMREFVRYGHREINDIGQLLHATVFMIGAAYAMRWDGHVRVDIFYSGMSARRRAVVDLVGTVFFILPWLVIVTRDSIPVVVNSWKNFEAFAETYTSGYFLLKSQLLVFAFLIGMQALANVIRAIRCIAAER